MGSAALRGLRALVPCLVLLCSIPALALTLEYTERSGAQTIRHTLVFEPGPGGYSVSVSSETAGSLVVLQTLETDNDLAVLSWRYIEEAAGTDMTATRDDAAIVLAGRYRGESVGRRLKIDTQPWYQLFPLGLERLAKSHKGSVRFWAVGTTGISAMRAGSFRAVVGELEQIDWNGTRVPAVRVRISLAGLTSILWHGDYWYRPGDGRHLVSWSNRGPGTASLKIELTAER